MPEVRLIDANALRYDLCVSHCPAYDICGIQCSTIRLINTQPTIEAEPVKHAKWVYGYCKAQEIKCYYCSNCGNDAYWDTDYGQQLFEFCPYCGARMDERELQE